MMFLILLIFSFIWTACQAQPSYKCIPSEPPQTNFIPRSCMEIYLHEDRPANGNINESNIFPGIRQALDELLDGITITSENYDSCAQLVQRYFCDYYYPFCDVQTGVITPVCSSSCNLLFNNKDCSDILMEAISVMEDQGFPEVPSNNSCEETFLPLTGTPEPTVSEDNCISIDEQLDEPLPLTCVAAPIECAAAVRSTGYAPGAQVSDDPDDIIDEIMRISQIPGLAMCAELINMLNCIFTYPVCDATMTMIRPVCESQCETISEQLAQCLGRLPSEEFPLVTENIFSEVTCDHPESYYNFPSQYILDSTNNAECLMIALLSTPTSDTNSDSDNSDSDAAIIIGVVLSVIFVIIIVAAVIIVLLAKRKRGSQKHTVKVFTKVKHNQESESSLRYVSTVRQHEPRSNGEEDNSLKLSNSSLQIQTKHFLQHVKEKFSEVLLPSENVTKLEIIGKGAFGMVHKGKLVMADGSIKAVAIKTLKSGSLDAMKDFVTESSTMKTFHHPNVLPLLGVCIDYDDEDVLKIIVTFMANGDLRNFLKDNRVLPNNIHEYPKNISEELLKKICLDIAKGMEYLAERRFVHRDLAARNCMVDENLSIKVADFGLARDIYTTEYYRMNQHTTLPVKWMPLESLLDGYFDEKTDVWSYGVTCWEIFSLGRIPYPGVDNVDVINFLKSGKRLEQPELCPSKMYEMIKNTWYEEPEKRPSFTDIIQVLHEQNVEDTSVDETERTINTDHLNLSNSH